MTVSIQEVGLRESLEAGGTLPGSWYTAPAVFELEQERIFGRSWQYAGLAGELVRSGDYATWTVGRIPVVVLRDEEGRVRAFANVCRHRGSLIVQEERGHRMSLQCPYHAWTYGLDGCLRSAPRADRNELFDPAGIRLLELDTHVVGPLVFVNPDPASPPFESFFGELVELLRGAHPDLGEGLRLYETHTVELPVNWKVVCENNFECYHCPTNHPGLAEVQDVTHDNEYDLHEYFQRAGPIPKSGSTPAEDGGLRAMEITEETRGAEWVNFLWPNFWCRFFTLPPGKGAIMLQIQPLAVDRSRYVRQYCFSDDVDERVRRESVDFVEQVLAEDAGLCVNAQRGIESGVFEQGRLLLPTTEPAIQGYERMVYRALVGE